jgi:hypothetical protein
MATKTYAELAADLRSEPSEATMTNILSSLEGRQLSQELKSVVDTISNELASMRAGSNGAEEQADIAIYNLLYTLHTEDPSIPEPSHDETSRLATRYIQPAGGARRRKTSKFDRCVKKVRKTVKARKGSNKESAAIAICTTSVLHPRGRTLKRYRKGRLTTQKKFRV